MDISPLEGIFTALSLLLVSGIFLKLYLRSVCGICRSKRRLDGKVVVITGATSGIGYETARNLVGRGAKLILGVRDLKRGEITADRLRHSARNRNLNAIVIVKKLDLTSLASVRRFSKYLHDEFKYIDILINNAGLALLKKEITEDGLEKQMAGNHLGPFLLTNLLLDLLINCPTKDARIVNVSSSAHKMVGHLDVNNLNSEIRYDRRSIYGQTKLCNILFTNELHEKLQASGFGNTVTVNCLHPGVVKTDLFRDVKSIKLYRFLLALGQVFFKTPWEGAQTTIHLAVSEELYGISGLYWVDCKNAQPTKLAEDKLLAKQVWDRSAELVKLGSNEIRLK